MKRALSLVLASALAVGMSVTGFAASTKYSEFASGKTLANGYDKQSEIEDSNTANLGDIYAKDEVERKIVLTRGMFLDEDGKETTGKDADKLLSSAEIRDSKIQVRTTLKNNSKVIKPITLDTRKAEIKIEFTTEWVSTKTEDFEVRVYLTIDGKRYDDEGLTLIGTFGNSEEEVYADYDYVDLSKGVVAVAEEYVPEIEVDLGNGVKIYTKLFKGKKYYGIANREPDESDDVVFTKYPDVDDVVKLQVVGLNSTGDVVKLELDYEDYYVYDKDLKYVGRSNEMLPYSSKYYLANQKLDISGSDDVEEGEDDESSDSIAEEIEPDITEPTVAPTQAPTQSQGYNPMDNPDTGVNSFVSIAVVAAALSLAAIGVVSRRKK